MMKKNSNNKKGFTLIELLVVIAIIGLLSVLSVVALGSARKKANDAKRLSDIKQVQTALELYYTDNNEYPNPYENAVLGAGEYACINSNGFGALGCVDAYMPQIPTDPNKGMYVYSALDGSSYLIVASLESGAGTFTAGPLKTTPSGMTQ